VIHFNYFWFYSIFSFCDGPITKKIKWNGLSQNVYGAISSFGVGYVRYKSRTLGKGYGVQCGVTGNSFWNTLGTKKFNTHTLPQKKKNPRPCECMLPHLIGCKNVFASFGLAYKGMNYGCILKVWGTYSCFHFYFIFQKGVIWLAHHQYFWNMGTPQLRSLNMLPSPKIEACFPLAHPPLQSRYMEI
jgi:hypothetical protein